MLTLQNISVGYGKATVLKDISLAVSGGETVALVGPNGAGKTTMIKTISGILRPRSGRIMVDDLDVASMNEPMRARRISVVPQAHQLGGAFTVQHTVMLGRTVYMGWLGAPSEVDETRVAWSLERVGIQDLAERRVAELSGGEQQLVLLARALAQQTPVMLLDEPTNHLDLRHQTDLLMLVRRLARQEGLAVLMAIHDLNLVSLFADRAALLVDGALECLGTPEEVLTSDNIYSAYRTRVEVFKHPKYGYPVILPQNQPED